jgi:putative nucleotidyltransferase with HDIG domain
MYVHAFTDQAGALSVKSQGHVKSQAVIESLKNKGVISLVIDTAKQLAEKKTVDNVEPPPSTISKNPRVSFNQEIGRAEKLHKQGKSIQKTLLKTVRQGKTFDQRIPKEFATEMVGSIERNADALVCLTKIRDKDDYLLEHSLNVAILLANFGQSIGMSTEEVESLAHAGFLHDIGKIKIEDTILHKAGKLNDAEMEIMKKHVVYGIETLRETGIAEKLIKTVSEHHERLDGLGYPFGKKGAEISKQGRMIAIVDVYDALTADRVYKKGMSGQKALQILLKGCPEKYDHKLLQQFIKCMGIYPLGSLVKLSNDRIGIVIEQNNASPLKPKVRTVYSTRGNHYLDGKEIDLSSGTVRIEKPVTASEYRIDTQNLFNRYILNSSK